MPPSQHARIDAHVHLERGPYRREWLDEFIDQAIRTGVTELHLLEHSHRFTEFRDVYAPVRDHSPYQRAWYDARARVALREYLDFVHAMRRETFPLVLLWGLEVCHLPSMARTLERLDLRHELDFLTGSVHWLDGWGFDHRPEHWQGKDEDAAYRRYFELELELIESTQYDRAAHPDAIKCFGHRPSFDLARTYDGLARRAAECKVAFEQNTGLHHRLSHPQLGLDPQFLEILVAHEVEVLTASDAHAPLDVGRDVARAEVLVHAARAASRSASRCLSTE